MKKKFLKIMENSIRKQYPSYSNEKIEEIMYGIEGIYLLITKCIIIFSLALMLGIFKELILLLVTYNVARTFAFGMHASKSWVCLVFSSIMFIGGTYLCKYVVIPHYVLFVLYFVALIIMILYSPADTVKRPLIKKKKRIKYKILSILVTISYFIISLFIKNNLVINCLIIGLLIECVLILPITYRTFKMPYKNYLNYGLSA